MCVSKYFLAIALSSYASIAVSAQEILSASLPLLAENGIVLDNDLNSSDLSSESLYFGTGLCTTREMSAGIPFDYLGLVATAETTRRIYGFGKVIQLIADSHAKTNHFVSEEEVDQKAQEFKELSLRAAHNLGLDSTFEVILASEIDSSPEYNKIYSSIPAKDETTGIDLHEYVRKQWTDMEYLAQMHNTRLKISWMMPLKKGQAHRSDEAFFDEGFKKQLQRPYSFIYNRAALTFDPNRLNVCPYTSALGEKRLLINATQDAQVSLAEFCAVKHKAKDKALEQTATIAAYVEQLLGATASNDALGNRVNHIIRQILR